MRAAAGSESGSTGSVVVLEDRAVVRNGLVAALRAVGHDALGVRATSEIDLLSVRPFAIVCDGSRVAASIADLHRQICAVAPSTRLLVVGDSVDRTALGPGPELIRRSCGADGIADALSRPAPATQAHDHAPANSERGLSDTERAILRFIAQGATAREAASGLGISRRTVENHKRRMFDRLGAVTQAQAVSLAIRAGELSTLEKAS